MSHWRDGLRNRVLDLVLVSLRVGLRVLSAVVPTSRSVVLAVSPETEGNGVEVAQALVRRYPGRIVWLRDGGAVPPHVRDLADRGVVLTPKLSPAGLWAYLRAEAVLFTHGLYGNPRPRPRKPVVNLWHGDGPKDITPGPGVGGRMASTYLVGNTRLFSEFQARAFGVPLDHVLLTGNSRTDQLWRPPTPERLAGLGITGDFVVWLPTFRRARAVGAMHVNTGVAVEPEQGRAELGPLLEGLRERGLLLVVKPHPLDSDRRRFAGVVTIDDDDLAAAEVGLYELLGQAAGLVTDYSSVWVDYLLVDRPLAFSVPDRGTYDRALFPPDILSWVPGEVVDLQARPFAEFLADLDAGGREGADQRAAVADRIGLTTSRTAADDLLAELARRGVLTLRG